MLDIRKIDTNTLSMKFVADSLDYGITAKVLYNKIAILVSTEYSYKSNTTVRVDKYYIDSFACDTSEEGLNIYFHNIRSLYFKNCSKVIFDIFIKEIIHLYDEIKTIEDNKNMEYNNFGRTLINVKYK